MRRFKTVIVKAAIFFHMFCLALTMLRLRAAYVVDFYKTRFDLRLNNPERLDLTNFLNAL